MNTKIMKMQIFLTSFPILWRGCGIFRLYYKYRDINKYFFLDLDISRPILFKFENPKQYINHEITEMYCHFSFYLPFLLEEEREERGKYISICFVIHKKHIV